MKVRPLGILLALAIFTKCLHGMSLISSSCLDSGTLAFSDGMCFDMPHPPTVSSPYGADDAIGETGAHGTANECGSASPVECGNNDANHAYIVGDIVSMNLISIVGLDQATRFDCSMSRVAWYRVSVHVRKCMGDFPCAKFVSFPVAYVERAPEWVYFKGMTLGFDAAKVDGVWRIVSASLVVPYPPFGKEGIKAYFDRSESERGEVLSFCKKCGLNDDGNRPIALIRYPNGITILYRAGVQVTSEEYIGRFFDFTNSELYVDVGFAPESASYLENSWISEARNGNEPFARRLDIQSGKK